MHDLRETIKDNGLSSMNTDFAVVRLAHVSCMRGLTRQSAPLIMRLMERRAQAGLPIWCFDEEVAQVLGITMVRLVAAYLEDPRVPISKANEATDLFIRSISEFPRMASVCAILPLIAAVRTQSTNPSFEPAKRSSGLPPRADMKASGMCASAHRQWRVEYLLATGAEDDAIELAYRGRSESPCQQTCAFAPHSMNAWLLEPLVRRNRYDDAKALSDCLTSALTPRVLYLNPMGHHIHYLALVGRFEEAARLLGTMLPLARENDASPWQRLKFYEGCSKAIELAKDAAQEEDLMTFADLSVADAYREISEQKAALKAAFLQRALCGKANFFPGL